MIELTKTITILIALSLILDGYIREKEDIKLISLSCIAIFIWCIVLVQDIIKLI